MDDLTEQHGGGTATLLHSPVLLAAGFAHGFSTRMGGVSPPPFDSLNLGIASAAGLPDSSANVAENMRRFLAAADLATRRVIRLRQVHGCAVTDHWVEQVQDADAAISSDAKDALVVRTADCVGILIGCTHTGAAAAIHAGWRGVAARIVPTAIARMLDQFGCEASSLVAAIGPSISVRQYEVGGEVADAFHAVGLSHRVHGSPDKNAAVERFHVDCGGAVLDQLVSMGVQRKQIDVSASCTFEDSARFFSARRDGPRSGRMAAAITPA